MLLITINIIDVGHLSDASDTGSGFSFIKKLNSYILFETRFIVAVQEYDEIQANHVVLLVVGMLLFPF